MLETVLWHYPFVTYYEGMVSLFPDNKDPSNAVVEEFEADAFRDTGWHWRSLELAVRRLQESGRTLPAMNLYAMEEITELLSFYSVALMKVSGWVARNQQHESILASDVKRANLIFESARRNHCLAQASIREDVEQKRQARRDQQREVMASIRSSYIDDIFSDVTTHWG